MYIEPTIYHSSHYGDGNGPIVYSNVDCKGWEDGIIDCTTDNYLYFTCSQGHAAGVMCNGDSNTPLIDSRNNSVGIVGGVLGSVMFLVILAACAIVVALVIIMR